MLMKYNINYDINYDNRYLIFKLYLLEVNNNKLCLVYFLNINN